MTEREKIIKLAKKCGAVFDGSNWKLCIELDTDDLATFYHAVQADAFEQAASLSVDWGNARKDNHGGNACRNLADAIRQLGKEKK